MWVEIHDQSGRVQIDELTVDGLNDAKFQAEQLIEEIKAQIEAEESETHEAVYFDAEGA